MKAKTGLYQGAWGEVEEAEIIKKCQKNVETMYFEAKGSGITAR